MAKEKITNIATRDAVFSVLGDRETIAKYIEFGGHLEYLHFQTIGSDKQLHPISVLNHPREIVIIGEEHEIELDDEGFVVSEVRNSDESTKTLHHSFKT